MDLPLPIVTAIMTALLGGAGFLVKRAVASFDSISASQVQIAQALVTADEKSGARHGEVMDALRQIADAVGLSARVDALEKLVMGAGGKDRSGAGLAAVPASQSAGSRGSRPGRG